MKRSRITPISAKRRREMRELANIREDKSYEYGPWCQLRIEGVCTGREQGLHHLRKRRSAKDDTPENTMLSCNACNDWVENHPDEATRRGFVIRGKAVA